MAESAEPVEVRDLRVTYPGSPPVEVLAGLDLSVRAGSFVAVVGPSGCGKSTLLRVLAGLDVPASGEALVGGRPVAGRPGHAAYMPQKDLLLPWRRVLGNAVLGPEIDGEDADDTESRARSLLSRFGLTGFEGAWPHQLSGGMRQRVALLRTFLLRRGVLLLDEPFGALDALTRADMVAWLQDVWAADQRTVVLVTHDVEEALLLGDRVVVLAPRPARIADDVGVDLPRPRRPESVTDPGFVALRARVLESLAGGRQRPME